jgi:ATP-dependent RNA helicase SUPV3L1/SUV3
MRQRTLKAAERARGVTAVLGPTNTGKTHLAIERMLGHGSGMIGLPLRLLAREVYQRVVERAGVNAVALVTGEEKIKPDGARYWIATAEAMPRDLNVDFVAIDEIQLGADSERGHVFTDRLLNQRGRHETLVIGAGTMRGLIETLLPGANIVSRPRLSKLTFAGEKKLSRLPARTAIVAFSAEEVYAVAELMRRQKGGAAVVLGALSPRTRNAQVELYQNGDVDYLVATDAIGMGLNLDVDHVAFAADRKFDGHRHRHLMPAEIGQIAGRAGRYLRDGTFGTSGRCPPFDPELIQAVEDHVFEPVRLLQWRNADLDFSSIAALQASLAVQPQEPGLTRAPMADDEVALEIASRDPQVRDLARGLTATGKLWDVAQVPDYRRVAPNAHAELVITIFTELMRRGRLANDWFARHVNELDRTDGDIDTLSARIAQIRTWTFVANRSDWLPDPRHWQGVTRQVEDRLSDALHERLAQRFVDRRTSVLMRRLRENAIMDAEITATGDVIVEGQAVGTLLGFHFAPASQAESPEGKALRAAASRALTGEIEARADRLAQATDDALLLGSDGHLRWQGAAIGRLIAGDSALKPRLKLSADDMLAGATRDKAQARLDAWIEAQVKKHLAPLLVLEGGSELTGIARGLAFQIAESLGVLERSRVADDVKTLDQAGRSALRNLGVRFGAYHLYVPALLKPAPRTLAAQLWALRHGTLETKGLDEIPHLAASGRTSIPVDKDIPKDLYRVAGFRVCGERAVRVDILERLADLIRPAIAYRPGTTVGEPPPGTADDDGFVVTVAMTSLAGCSGEDFASILRSLGYVSEKRAGEAITKAILKPAPTRPVSQAIAEAAGAIAADDTAAAGTVGADVEAPAASADIEAAGEASGEASGEAPAVSEADTSAQDSPDASEAIDSSVADPHEITAPGGETPASEASAAGVADGEGAASEAAPDAEVTAAEVTAAEAPADQTPDAGPAEPVLIEIWRPFRHQHRGRGRPEQGRQARGEGRPGGQDRRPRHDQRALDQRKPDGRPSGERAADTRPPGGRPAGGRPAGQPGEASGPRQEGRPEGRQEGRQEGRFGQRFDRPRPDRPAGEGGPREGQRPGGSRPGEQRPGEGRQGGDRNRFEGGRPRDDRGQQRRFEQPGARDRRPEKQPDPDSPFAKLLALKAQLEGKQVPGKTPAPSSAKPDRGQEPASTPAAAPASDETA